MASKLFLLTAAGAIMISPVFAQQQTDGAQQPQQQQEDVEQQPAQQQQEQEQEQQEQQQAQGQQLIAEQCLEELRAEAQRMEEEGYWLTGWGRRWGTGAGAPDATPEEPAATDATSPPRPGAAGVRDTGPWPAGPAGFGVRSPSYQIRTLYAAGNVLAFRGEEEACRAVLGELRAAYDDYVGELQQAEVEPGDITTWRQERIGEAQPIAELERRGIISVDDVTGMEVRNPEDERLGSVDDIIFDPETGEVSYAVVARGGFFGIGEDYVAVPWQQFGITPGLNVLVLNVTEEELEEAPEIDPERFADPQVFTDSQERTDQFWQQREG